MPRDIDEAARALWNACPTPKPAWEDLSDTTKDVWREKVAAGITPADYLDDWDDL